MRPARLLALALALAGCATANHAPGPGPGDQALPSDGGGGDAHAGGDLAAAPDLAAPIDAPAGDLAANGDQAAPAGDLAGSPDLAARADLAVPADLAAKPDLATADLANGADLAMVNNCVPQTQPCDLICQNCLQGLKCSLNGQNAPTCFNNGNVADGQPCGQNNTDNCVAGDICIRESQMLMLNLCRGYCRVDGDCKNGGKCVFTIGGTNVKFCSDKITGCDPVKQTGCQAGSCYVVTPDAQTGCHQAGAGGYMAPCGSDWDCQAGYACFGVQGCLHICHMGVNTDCANGLKCYNVNGWNTYGICSP
jgi:hypothetical protein